MEHLGSVLSAYLDDRLVADERGRVEAHLADCAACRSRLADLRATARLVAALPVAHPTRSLLPKLAVIPAWVRPVRSLAAIASGAFVMLFVASLALSTGLGGGGKGAILVGAPLSTGGATESTATSFQAPAVSDTSAPARDAERSSAESSRDAASSTGPSSGPQLGHPLVWLALAAGCALLGYMAHRRTHVIPPPG